jgi:anti-sigma regulatory factor (Ser/Thr protein kinase)
LQTQLALDRSAPRAARELADSLRAETDVEAIELVRLVLSELATNCAQHGGGDSLMTVTVDLSTADQIHVEVDCPSGTSQPHIARAGQRGSRGGLGLRLIDTICTDWGIRQDDKRTIVWADVPSAPAESPRLRESPPWL